MEVKVKLNFIKKQGKEEHWEKDHPEITDNIEHENMPKIFVCDTCKNQLAMQFCNCN